MADIFGYNALQLGAPEFDFLRANRMPFRFTAGAGRVQVRDRLHRAGCRRQHLTWWCCPTCSFASSPRRVREVERVLVPQGQVVIAGFNPLSLFGLRRRLAGGRQATRGTGNICPCGA